jgi:hypothetical protein
MRTGDDPSQYIAELFTGTSSKDLTGRCPSATDPLFAVNQARRWNTDCRMFSGLLKPLMNLTYGCAQISRRETISPDPSDTVQLFSSALSRVGSIDRSIESESLR